MFVNQTHLPQLLGAEWYTSQDIFQREVEQLFVPGWHCLAIRSELPGDGDYVAVELLGRPLLLWNRGGEVQAFLNVCPHRSCMLRDGSGHAAPHLRCQYHGWEFDPCGTPRKIPDARSFRPLEKGRVGLTRYRTETIGQLVFVTLDPNAPSLADYLGPSYDLLRTEFSDKTEFYYKYELEHEANWKVPVENTLESYHTTEVHPRTFGTYPEEQWCEHELHGWWDSLRVDYSTYKSNRTEKFIGWLAGVRPELTYRHLMRYPNIVWSLHTWYNSIWVIHPVSPTRTREVIWDFGQAGDTRRLGSRIARRLLKWHQRYFSKRVRDEDAAIFPKVQQGLAAADRPSGGGLISVREERIFAFQKWLLEQMGEEVPEPAEEAMAS